jgi:RNA polymerase sigma-70 factor, ECF subfamily
MSGGPVAVTRGRAQARPVLSEAAYARLVERHRAELQAHCRRMLGSAHDAEDALQEALLRAWRSLPQFEGRGSARWWLYRIATNAALDALRRRRMHLVSIEDDPPEAGPETDPEGRYARREAVDRALVTADRLLTDRQRDVLILREVLGFSAEETATRLETSVPAVNSALQRARATLDARAAGSTGNGAAQAA